MCLKLFKGYEVDKFVHELDVNEFPLRLIAVSRFRVVIRMIWVECRFVDAMFLNNLHNTGDTWNGAVAMVEESEIALRLSVTAWENAVKGNYTSRMALMLLRATGLRIPSHPSGFVLLLRSSIEKLTSTPFSMRGSGSAFINLFVTVN